MSNRREKFREYMARFDAAADPQHALDRGFYVPRPGREPVDRLVGRLELQPATMHLVVGGIGSGKTTQLLVAQERLNQWEDTRAVYIDISQYRDLDNLHTGALAAIAGLALCELLPPAHPMRIDSEPHLKYTASTEILKLVKSSYLHTISILKKITSYLETETHKNIILIFDSLDRIANLHKFARLVEDDLAAISSIGIGVVTVGPIRAMYGIQRLIAERFRYTYYQPTVDIWQDAAGRDFLLRVLRQRASEELLPEPVCQQLIALSGGVLRDLISLARQAVEEAYLDREDTVMLQHVATASDTFGRSLMIGLTAKDIEVLQRVLHNGSFVETSEQDLALLATRQVLEYKETELRYAVHPTLEPLLKQLTGGA